MQFDDQSTEEIALLQKLYEREYSTWPPADLADEDARIVEDLMRTSGRVGAITHLRTKCPMTLKSAVLMTNLALGSGSLPLRKG